MILVDLLNVIEGEGASGIKLHPGEASPCAFPYAMHDCTGMNHIEHLTLQCLMLGSRYQRGATVRPDLPRGMGQRPGISMEAGSRP